MTSKALAALSSPKIGKKKTNNYSQSSGISNLLEEADLDGMLALTLAYMYERSLGKNSPWFEFLETIDEVSEATIPRFWTIQEQEWLVGSEVEYMGGLDPSEVTSVYEDDVKPFIETNNLFENRPDLRTYEGYRDSLVAVSGRAFEVDVYRGLSLVPGACLFNHTNTEDVHFESQDGVCPVCGDANFCEHALEYMNDYSGDEDEDDHGHGHSHDHSECGGHGHSHSHSHTSSSKAETEEPAELTVDGISDESDEDSEGEEDGFEDIEEDIEMDGSESEGEKDNEDEEDDDEDEDEDLDTCDIIAVKTIPAQKEVFNTYGELSNGVLLSRYGFALWDNEHETVSLGKELLAHVKENGLKKRTAWWAEHFYRLIFGIDPEDWSEDMFDPEHEDDEEEDLPPPSPDSITWLEILDLFSNGVPSPGLMAILYLLSLDQTEYDAFIAKVESGDYDSISFNNRGLALLKTLVEVRAKRYADGNMSSADCEKLLASIESDASKSRERLALIVRGTEKLVIERNLEWISRAGKTKKGKTVSKK